MGTPPQNSAELAESARDTSTRQPGAGSLESIDSYFSYESAAAGSEKVESDPTFSDAEPQKEEGLAFLQSKPFKVSPIKNRSGSTSYRVTGTINGKQFHRSFQLLEDAEDQQEVWENQRIAGARASRPKITSLSKSELKEAEALFLISKQLGIAPLEALNFVARIGPKACEDVQKAVALAKNEPFTLEDAARAAVRAGLDTRNRENITFQAVYDQYIVESANRLAIASQESVGQRIRSFGRHVGLETSIGEITEADALAWLKQKTKDGSPHRTPGWRKTWNNLIGDVSPLFSFCIRKRWLQINPFSRVERFDQKLLRASTKQRARLSIESCSALMAHVEQHHPKWCCYFAITLFAGIRPDVRSGEMWELAKCVRRDGIDSYYSNGKFHLSAEITKEKDGRTTTVSASLAAWLKKYPPTPENICPGDYRDEDYRSIRKMFRIPHDGLRHTAISAFISSGRTYSEAADEFGNSETIIKRHYLNRMSAEEARAFYAIFPNALKVADRSDHFAAETVRAGF